MKSSSLISLLAGVVIGLVITYGLFHYQIIPSGPAGNSLRTNTDTVYQYKYPVGVVKKINKVVWQTLSEAPVVLLSNDTAMWAITVLVEDKTGPVKGASVSIPCLGDETFTTDDEGKVKIESALGQDCPCNTNGEIFASKDHESGSTTMTDGCGSYTVNIAGKD